MSVRNCILVLFLICKGFIILAQAPLFKHYSVDEGLPSSESYNIMQDKDGYIWISTDLGPCKFNGYSFNKLSTNEGLRDNCVFECVRDRKENIWFKTLSGNLSYITPTGKIYSPACNLAIKKWINGGYLNRIYFDDLNVLYVTGYSVKNFLRIKYPYNEKDAELIELPSNTYHYIKMVNGDIIAGGHPQPLSLDKKTQQVTLINEKDTTQLTIPTTDIWRNSGIRSFKLLNGDLLFTLFNDVFILRGKKIIIQKHFTSTLIHVYQDIDATIWLGFHKGGVKKFNSTLDKELAHYFPLKSVTCVKRDKDGGFWFSTLDDGVYYTSSFKYNLITQPNNIKDNRVTSIAIKNNKVLAGQFNGNVITLGNENESYDIINDFQTTNSVQQLYIRSNGDICIAGSLNTTIYSHNKKEPESINYTTKSITEDSSGNLWIASTFSIIKLKTGTTLNEALRINCPSRITKIAAIGKSIYICTLEGMYIYDFNSIKQVNLGKDYNKLKFSDVCATVDGTIYFSTIGKGIVVLHKSGTITNLTTRNNLASNMSRGVNNYLNYIWVATNSGISKITPRENNEFTIYNYNHANHLHTNDINDIVEKNDTLYLATNQGVAVFPESYLESNNIPVTITDIYIGGKSQKLKKGYTLSSGSANLAIHYVSLFFKKAGKLMYEYKLEGVDREWKTTKNTNIEYTTLPPGEYLFKIRAFQENGILNPITEIRLNVLKPFYYSIWFGALILLVTSIILYLIFLYRVRNFKIRERKKLDLQKRINTIEMKALRAQMNPHFIFNSLNAIQSFIVLKQWEKAQTYLTRFSRLVRNVLESSEHSYIPLYKEIETLTFYLEIEKMRFNNQFVYIIEKDPSIYKKEIHVPPMLIQPYVENAIKHGLLLKDGAALITLTFSYHNQILKISIQDNGLGRKKAAELKQHNQRKNHQSMGMKVTHERLALLKNIDESSQPVTIIDLEDEQGNPTGTRIELSIPA